MNWIKKSIKNKFMKSIILLFGIVLFYNCSARKKDSKGDNIIESTEEIIGEQYSLHEKLNIDSLLNSNYAKIIKLNQDELIIPLDSVMESDSSRVVVIGKFINQKDVFAFDFYGNSDACFIDFYKFNTKWEKLKSDKYDFWMLYDFRFENFNNDEDQEILFHGPPNVNGNQLNTIYKFNSKENRFVKSGNFFCNELQFDTNKNLIYFEYGGSWYTPNEKSIFKWIENKILPIKKVRIELKKYNYKSFDQWISYYENPTQDKDTLVLKFKKTYKEKNKKMYDLWENFFE